MINHGWLVIHLVDILTSPGSGAKVSAMAPVSGESTDSAWDNQRTGGYKDGHKHIYHSCSFFSVHWGQNPTHSQPLSSWEHCKEAVVSLTCLQHCIVQNVHSWLQMTPKETQTCLAWMGYEPATPQSNHWNMGLSLPLSHPASFFIRCICNTCKKMNAPYKLSLVCALACP